MKKQEYVKIVERELQRVNKIIDYKIIHGIEYAREARDHKLLLRKMRQHTGRSFFQKLFPTMALF